VDSIEWDDMAVTKKIVSVKGILRGEGHERKCQLRALRHVEYADESPTPTCTSYSKCEIEDADDFPDGSYEVEFEGHLVPVLKTAGQYSLRCS
jgi:hypothetical protein